jgi:putative tryptophan/tyrosine transport system substrate-binding protein
MIIIADSLTNLRAPRLVALAAEYHLPAIHLFKQFANGGLIVYGPNIADLWRRAGDKILKGAKPFRSTTTRAPNQIRGSNHGPLRGDV